MNIISPTTILLAIALIWPFGQLLELPSFHPQAHLYGLDIAVAILAASLLLSKKSRKSIATDPLTKPIAAFTLVASLSLLLVSSRYSPPDLLIAASYLVRWVAYTSIYFAVRYYKKPDSLRKTILITLATFTIIGLIQYVFLPDVRSLFFFGFDDHFYRLVSTFLDPNFTGLALVVFILLLLGSPGINKGLIFIPTIALALTFSRASFLTLIISLIIITLRKPKKIYLYIFAAIIIGLVLAPKPYGEGVNLLRTFSISSRIEDTRYGISLFLDRPLLGQGFNILRSIKPADPYIPTRSLGGLSNSFVFLLATTGLVGFTSYLYLLKKIITNTSHALFINTSIIAILIHSLFNHSLFYIWILSLFWALTALATRNKKP